MIPDKTVADAWVAVLPADRKESLFPLRLFVGLEVASSGERIWVRGRGESAELRVILASLPVEHQFVWLTDGRLQPYGSRLITDVLPALRWEPLRDWLPIELPARLARSVVAPRTALRLAPDLEPREANALIVSAQSWSRWADGAPQIRLNPLRFAADASGRVLILGKPLPSLPGIRMVEREGVIVPLGRAWHPVVSAAVIRRACGASPDAIVLWDERGTQVLGVELFVPASRAAARATAGAGINES